MRRGRGQELKVAFGLLGALGVVAAAAGVVRRSFRLAVLGGAAVAADMRFAALRGWAATRSERRG